MKNLSVVFAFLVSVLCLGASLEAQADRSVRVERIAVDRVSLAGGDDDKGDDEDDDEKKEEDFRPVVSSLRS
jgi:hypothetical protein